MGWLCIEMTSHILAVDVNLRVDIYRMKTGYISGTSNIAGPSVSIPINVMVSCVIKLPQLQRQSFENLVSQICTKYSPCLDFFYALGF